MTRRLLFAFLLLIGVPTLASATGFTSDRITVRTEGSGPDVILVPGLTSSPAAWKYAVKAVPGYRYHLVQVKGFAGTPAEGNAKGDLVKGSAEEVARYIAEAKLDKPAIIGHSMGGSVGMMVAARHPQAVSKLMVVDMLPFMGAMFGPPGATADSVRPVADAMLAQMKAATPEARLDNLKKTTAGMVATESERAAVVQSAIDSDPAVSAQTFHELVVTDLGTELPNIAVPTTVLYVTPTGAPVSDAQMDAYYNAAYAPLKGVTLVRVPDSAHFIMYDNQDFFHAQMKAFLDK